MNYITIGIIFNIYVFGIMFLVNLVLKKIIKESDTKETIKIGKFERVITSTIDITLFVVSIGLLILIATNKLDEFIDLIYLIKGV